jgi:hypothetical protein
LSTLLTFTVEEAAGGLFSSPITSPSTDFSTRQFIAPQNNWLEVFSYALLSVTVDHDRLRQAVIRVW